MKTKMTDTSLEAYQNLIKNHKLSPMRRNVMFCLYCANKPMSSAMLEKYAQDRKETFGRLPRCTITGRFNELEDMNLIKVVETKICEVTGYSAKYYVVVEV